MCPRTMSIIATWRLEEHVRQGAWAKVSAKLRSVDPEDSDRLGAEGFQRNLRSPQASSTGQEIRRRLCWDGRWRSGNTGSPESTRQQQTKTKNVDPFLLFRGLAQHNRTRNRRAGRFVPGNLPERQTSERSQSSETMPTTAKRANS
jgi:hypothetical protein